MGDVGLFFAHLARCAAHEELHEPDGPKVADHVEVLIVHFVAGGLMLSNRIHQRVAGARVLRRALVRKTNLREKTNLRAGCRCACAAARARRPQGSLAGLSSVTRAR